MDLYESSGVVDLLFHGVKKMQNSRSDLGKVQVKVEQSDSAPIEHVNTPEEIVILSTVLEDHDFKNFKNDPGVFISGIVNKSSDLDSENMNQLTRCSELTRESVITKNEHCEPAARFVKTDFREYEHPLIPHKSSSSKPAVTDTFSVENVADNLLFGGVNKRPLLVKHEDLDISARAEDLIENFYAKKLRIDNAVVETTKDKDSADLSTGQVSAQAEKPLSKIQLLMKTFENNTSTKPSVQPARTFKPGTSRFSVPSTNQYLPAQNISSKPPAQLKTCEICKTLGRDLSQCHHSGIF